MSQDNNLKTGKWKDGYVSWKVYAWTISIIVMLFGVVFSTAASLSTRLDACRSGYTEIQVQLSQIQTDILWIKNQLQ